MEPTIYLSFLSISIYYLFLFIIFLFDTQYQYSFLFRGEMPQTKKIVVGKVIVAKAVGIIILYTGRIRFVIIEKGKKKNN